MKTLFINSLLILVLVLFNFRDVSNKYQEAYRFDFDFELSDLINSVVISNETNESVLFTFDLNNRFPLSHEKMKRDIIELSTKNKISPIIAAWLYVMKMTYHSVPITSDNWQHEPSLFLNSVGGGFCDDLSSVLTALWQLMGYDARVMLLEGHVVAEVKDSSGWHMYDPDLMVYYTDEKGRVLSVEELEGHSEIVAYPNLDIDSNLNPLLRSANYLTKDLAGFYGTIEDNEDITEWSLGYSPISINYTLPKKSKLAIVRDQHLQQNAVVVTLSKWTKGVLDIPLVPVYAVGNFEFTIGENKIKLNGNKYRFSEEEQIRELEISKVHSTGKIYYRLNPKLELFEKTNEISISSSDSLSVTIQFSSLEVLEYADSHFLLDKYKRRHYPYLELAQNIKDSEAVVPYLLREFAQFLSFDTACELEEQLILREHMRERIIDLTDRALLTKDHLQKFYPILLYNLFITERYSRYGELNTYYFE